MGGIGPSKQGVSRRARFKIATDSSRNAQVLIVDGDITLETAGSLEYMAAQINRPVVVVDLSNSTMISGAAMSVLSKVLSNWQTQQRDVRLVAEKGAMAKSLKSSRLSGLAKLYTGRRQALRGSRQATNADVLVVEAPEAVHALEKEGLDVVGSPADAIGEFRGSASTILIELRRLETMGALKEALQGLTADWRVIVVGPDDRADVEAVCAEFEDVCYLSEPVMIPTLVAEIQGGAQTTAAA